MCKVQPYKPNRTNMSALQAVFLGQALIEYDPRRYYEQPLHDGIPLLATKDLVFTNFEGAVCAKPFPCEQTRFNSYFHGTLPIVLDYLQSIHVNMLSLANNHAWNWGDGSVLATLHEAEKRQFTTAGIGTSLREASQPQYAMFNGSKVALVAAVTLQGDTGAEATAVKPGFHRVEKGEPADEARVRQAIQQAKETADLVILHHHFHHYQDDNDTAWQRSFARTAIDAGASIYVGHGEATIKRIEIYRQKPILYGLGNFIFHTRALLGQYPQFVWEDLLCQTTFQDGVFTDLTLIPLVLNEGEAGPLFLEKRGYPSLAHGVQARAILQRVQELSAVLGTDIQVEGSKGIIYLR